MKKVESELEDELRPEYDLRSLRVRKLGPGRNSFGDLVRLEPDVADAFPDADAVNQAPFTIESLTPGDREWVRQFVLEHWHAESVVAHAQAFYPHQLPGFVATAHNDRIGLVTYRLDSGDCEIMTLDSLRPGIGVGTALIEAVKGVAQRAGCHRLWLITTNDRSAMQSVAQTQRYTALVRANDMKTFIQSMAIVFASGALILAQQPPRPLAEEKLNGLVISLHKHVQMQPGQSRTFSIAYLQCCHIFEPVNAHVVWSVERVEGAHIDPETGILTIGKSVPNGKLIEITANVENARRILKQKVLVYTLEANPLVGDWSEVSQIGCRGEELPSKVKVYRLELRADKTFALTWIPLELRQDYWGTYDFDLKNRRISLQIEAGNDVPEVVDREGGLSIDENGRLALHKIWLGSPAQYQLNEKEKGRLRPDICVIVFERRWPNLHE